MKGIVRAEIAGANVTSDIGDITITATSAPELDALAVGFSAAGLVAGVANIAVNSTENTTEALVGAAASLNSAGDVLVRAEDTANLNTDTVSLAGALGVGIGASLSANLTNNRTQARSAGSASAPGLIDLWALTDQTQVAWAVAFAAGGIVGGFASVVFNESKSETRAHTAESGFLDAPTITAHAQDDSFFNTIAGGAAVGGLVGAGAAIGTNRTATVVKAGFAGATVRPDTQLVVEAQTSLAITGFSAGLTAAGMIAGVGSVVVNELDNDTEAFIGAGADVQAPGVRVVATDTSFATADTAAFAVGGGVGAGASYATNTVKGTVKATISGGEVLAPGNAVELEASTTYVLIALAHGAAGAGFVAAVGSVSKNVIEGTTEASIGGGAHVDGPTGVTLLATDTSSLTANSGAMSVGGFADVGLSYAVSSHKRNVDALVTGAETEVDSAALLDIDATMTPPLMLAIASVFGVAGFVAANGAISAVETGGSAHAGITGGTVDVDSVDIDASATSPFMAATSNGVAAAGFATAGFMISEGLSGHGAVAEATGAITTGQLDVTAYASRNSLANVDFFQISVHEGAATYEAEGTQGTTEAKIGAGAVITIEDGGTANLSATSDDTADPLFNSLGLSPLKFTTTAAGAFAKSDTKVAIDGQVSDAASVSATAVANKLALAATHITSISVGTVSGIGLDGLSGSCPTSSASRSTRRSTATRRRSSTASPRPGSARAATSTRPAASRSPRPTTSPPTRCWRSTA